MIVESAFTGVIEKKLGHEIYLAVGDNGPEFFYAVEFINGVAVDSTAWDAKTTITRLEEIGLTSFDYNEALRDAVTARQEAYAAKGQTVLPFFVLDGAEWEVHYQFDGQKVRFQEWNPSYSADEYAQYDERLEKLREVIRLFAEHYGCSKLGL